MKKPGGESLESLQKNFSINTANIIATRKCIETCAIPASKQKRALLKKKGCKHTQ